MRSVRGKLLHELELLVSSRLSSGRLLLSGDGLELGFRLWFWSANTKSHASGKSKNPYLRILRKGFQFKRFLFLVNFQLPKFCDVEFALLPVGACIF